MAESCNNPDSFREGDPCDPFRCWEDVCMIKKEFAQGRGVSTSHTLLTGVALGEADGPSSLEKRREKSCESEKNVNKVCEGIAKCVMRKFEEKAKTILE